MRWLLPWLLLAPAAAAQPLIVGLVPDLPGASAGSDAAAVGALGPVDLAGHVLTDGESSWTLPPWTLGPGETLWLVGNLSAWQAHGGPGPAIELAPPMRLADDGDGVALLDPAGQGLDQVSYGDKDASGTLPGARPGLMLLRDGEAGAWTDTDRATDWATPRLHKVGESALGRPAFTAQRVTLYASPDSSFATLRGLVEGASERLHLHVYELRSPDLVDLLVAARQRSPGLDLQVLVDADPVGQTLSERHETADALRRVQAAGGTAVLAGNGRYDDHHLKVLVADGAVAVQSENWVASGVPRDPSWGNRGWGAVVHDRAAADWFAAWMAQDRAAWDAAPFDLADYDPTFEAPPRSASRTGPYGPIQPAFELTGPLRVTPLVAPEHTHDPRSDPVAAVLDAAAARIAGQQLDLALHARNGLGWSSPDPWAHALARAASRGVAVQVQAAAPFSAQDTGNRQALDWLALQGADATAFDRPGIPTLHNKGFVADGTVVLGSINGNHHSRSANREVALVLESPAAADWFATLASGDREPPAPPRDWGVPGQDLRALPAPPWPTLFALLGVGSAVRARR